LEEIEAKILEQEDKMIGGWNAVDDEFRGRLIDNIFILCKCEGSHSNNNAY